MKFNSKTSVTDFFKRVIHRIDGVLLCLLIAASAVLAVFPEIALSTKLLRPNVDAVDARLIFMIMPFALFAEYVWFASSINSKHSLLLCMVLLTTAAIPFIVIKERSYASHPNKTPAPESASTFGPQLNPPPERKRNAMTPDERKNYAQTMFAQHPEQFPEERRPSILNGIVTLGMTPFEAKLAGGAFAYKVMADPSRWSPDTDPFKVMWAQSLQPDNSEIWMTFKNATQFSSESAHAFRVYIKNGHAVQIEKLGE